METYHRLYIILKSSDLLFQIINTNQVINNDSVDLELLDSISDGDKFSCNEINF